MSRSFAAIGRSSNRTEQQVGCQFPSEEAPRPIAFSMASMSRAEEKGLYRYATQPRRTASLRSKVCWEPVMKMTGTREPANVSRSANSKPDMSPIWTSMTRHDALLTTPLSRNSFTEAKVSGEYPEVDSIRASTLRMVRSSSTTAIIIGNFSREQSRESFWRPVLLTGLGLTMSRMNGLITQAPPACRNTPKICLDVPGQSHRTPQQ